MSEKHTTRRTLSGRRAGQTDWQRLERMTDEEAEANAAADPENGLWTAEQLAAARIVTPERRQDAPVYVPMDAEVVAYFRAQGPHYQARINAVLRQYVQHARQGEASGRRF